MGVFSDRINYPTGVWDNYGMQLIFIIYLYVYIIVSEHDALFIDNALFKTQSEKSKSI